MEAILEEVVDQEDLKKFEKIYYEQAKSGLKTVSAKAQFEYAWCLARNKNYPSDLKKGVALLEDLYHRSADDHAKRDYLFYLAVGYTHLKEYDRALKFANGILTVEPKNHQAQQLKEHIEKKMKKDGLLGMAILGGGALVGIAGIIGAGIAIAKSKS